MKRPSSQIHLGADQPCCQASRDPEARTTTQIATVDCLVCLALVQTVMEALVNNRATPEEILQVRDSCARAKLPLTVDERVVLEERRLRAMYAEWESKRMFAPGLADREDWDKWRTEHRTKFENHWRVEQRLGRALEPNERYILDQQLEGKTQWRDSDEARECCRVLEAIGEPLPEGVAEEIQRLEQHEAKLEAQRAARAALRQDTEVQESGPEPFSIEMKHDKKGWQALVGNTSGRGPTPPEAVRALFEKLEPAKRK